VIKINLATLPFGSTDYSVSRVLSVHIDNVLIQLISICYNTAGKLLYKMTSTDSTAVTRNSESDGNICVVCFKSVDIFSIGICDHPVCYECSTRMRVLCKQMECPICRQELIKVNWACYLNNHLFGGMTDLVMTDSKYFYLLCRLRLSRRLSLISCWSSIVFRWKKKQKFILKTPEFASNLLSFLFTSVRLVHHVLHLPILLILKITSERNMSSFSVTYVLIIWRYKLLHKFW